MGVSLSVVVGLLLLMTRLAGRRYRGRSGSSVQVLQRQPLSRSSTVTVVKVGGRVLVLGTTEQQVRVLAELDPDELDADLAPELEQAPVTELHAVRPARDSASATPVGVLPMTVPPVPLIPSAPSAPSAQSAAATPYAAVADELLAELQRLETQRGEQSVTAPAPSRGAGVLQLETTASIRVGRHRASPSGARAAARTTVPTATRAEGPLAGSLLSVDTWRQALQSVSRRAS